MTEEPPPYGTPEPISGSRPPSESTPAEGSVARDEQHVMILGGLSRTGRWSVPRRTTVVSLIGGVDLDLRDATLPPGEVVLQHFSVIGGVNVTIPAHVAVRVSGLRLIGGQQIAHSEGPVTTTLVIRSFGVLGGVLARRA